jgi:hypothetical protein
LGYFEFSIDGTFSASQLLNVSGAGFNVPILIKRRVDLRLCSFQSVVSHRSFQAWISDAVLALTLDLSPEIWPIHIEAKSPVPCRDQDCVDCPDKKDEPK